MKDNQKHEKVVAFLNMGLTKDMDARLTAYCLERMRRTNAVLHGLKTQVARDALKEWLDKHEGDFDLEL